MRVGRLVVQRHLPIHVDCTGIDSDHVRSRRDHDDDTTVDDVDHPDRTDHRRARGRGHHGDLG
jgi:hypothetical protein